MSTIEKVEAAEAKMNAAQDALLRNIEAQASIDREDHRRLQAKLKKAKAEFLQAVFSLDK